MMRCWLTLAMVLWASLAQATNYYISPSGSNANNGTSTATPWLTFTHALANGWGCGDTLFLLDGTYGDGTSTGKVLVQNVVCTAGNEMVLRALNQRQARIHDNGTGTAVKFVNSVYITIDGIYASSTNNGTVAGAGVSCTAGQPIWIGASGIPHHIIIRNVIAQNANKYCNVSVIALVNVNDSLIEDTEVYNFHRHATGVSGRRNTVRRLYCNEREGGISGGYGNLPGDGDGCQSFYPCIDCISENVISDSTTAGGHYLAEVNALGSKAQVKFLGVIGVGSKYHGIYFNARGCSSAQVNAGCVPTDWTPTNNIVRHSVWLNHKGSTAVRSESASNTLVEHVTILGTSVSGSSGMYAGVNGAYVNAGNYSITMKDSLVTNMALGHNIQSGLASWSGDHLWAYGNTSAGFFPSPPSNWTNITNQTTDPAMGTCKAWIPAGSPLKGAASDGGDIGATILYRYVDGVLTTIPLWDPTDGSFPHGATVTGLNDVAGHSLFDFHTRININSGGCSFPSGYAGGGGGEPEEPPPDPEDPTDHASGTGTTSTSYAHVLPANTDAVSVQIALWDIEANVGSVSAVTVCGNSASLIPGTPVTTSPAYRRAEIWGYAPGTANTLSGSCTIAVTTTGNVDGVVTTSSAHADASAFNTGAAATALSSVPSVTITTNTNETIIDSLAASKTVTLSSGPDQTLRLDTAHGTQSLRGASSTQATTAGGVMSYTLGGNNYWALAAATVSPQGGSTPPSPIPELAQTKFRFHALYGTEASPTVKAATDTNIAIVPVGKIRLRIELTASEANYPATGLVLFCSHNGGAYAQAQDTFGSNAFRLIGGGADPDLPSSLTATTQQIGTGDFVPGAILRSTSASFAPAIPNGDHTEMEWALELNASAGDTVNCRVYQDNGTAIDTYTVTPTLTVIPMAAGGGM